MLLAGLLTLSLLTSPADTLRARLEGGETVSVVVLGDSIGDGMHLPDPDTEGFPALFVKLLGMRFPTAKVELHNLSIMAEGTSGFLASFDDSVPPLKPSIVIIQLGGNDKGTGDGLENLPTYQANLTELIHKAEDLDALPAIVAPPMHEPVMGMPYPQAAMDVAAAEGVPAANADVAIKTLGPDYRGLFPYFIHPREREHAAIALALDQAVAVALDCQLPCTVHLADGASEAKPGDGVPVYVAIENPTDQSVAVSLTSDQLAFDVAAVTVPANDKRAVAGTFLLPHTLSAGRSAEWPLLVTAEAEGRLGFAMARLAEAPIVRVPLAGAPSGPLVEMAEMYRVVGRGRWNGPADLSAKVYGAVDQQTLALTVAVRDDHVVGGDPPLYDGLELYFDLRGDLDRGKAYYARQVAMILVPPSQGNLFALTEDDPPQELLSIPTAWERTADGYRVTFTIARSSLDAVAGRRVHEFGFDLAVDDADGQNRKTQLVWFGRSDNFVNPRRFGQLQLDGDDPAGRVRVTVFP